MDRERSPIVSEVRSEGQAQLIVTGPDTVEVVGWGTLNFRPGDTLHISCRYMSPSEVALLEELLDGVTIKVVDIDG